MLGGDPRLPDSERRGYSYGHWIGCMCDKCARILKEHQARFRYGNSCGCPVCKWHRDKKARDERERYERMSSVNLCDRCETLVKGHSMGFLSFAINPGEATEAREFCPGCIEEFIAWLNGEHGERPKGYSRPYQYPKTDEPDAAEQLAKKIVAEMDKRPELPEAPVAEAEGPTMTARNRVQDDTDWE